MTCIVRFLFVLLFLALTHTASASTSRAAASGMGCHDAAHSLALTTSASATPKSTNKFAATPLHSVHAVQATDHLQHQASTERMHADCDCAQKCGCSPHCATSGLMTQSLWSTLTPSLPTFVATAIAIDLPSTRISSLFRPPIIALS